MGYRSDIALALTGQSLIAFKDRIKQLPEKIRGEVEDLLNGYADRHIVENGNECWLWKDLKWYTYAPEYYPDVDFVDRFLDEADSNDFYFVRIGEDYEDNEIRGDWWDNPFGLYLSRSIMLDC